MGLRGENVLRRVENRPFEEWEKKERENLTSRRGGFYNRGRGIGGVNDLWISNGRAVTPVLRTGKKPLCPPEGGRRAQGNGAGPCRMASL